MLAILAFYDPHCHPVISEANQLKATAYHEAGHAVAFDRFGFKIKKVTIVRKGERLGACPIKHLRLHRADVVGRRACANNSVVATTISSQSLPEVKHNVASVPVVLHAFLPQPITKS